MIAEVGMMLSSGVLEIHEFCEAVERIQVPSMHIDARHLRQMSIWRVLDRVYPQLCVECEAPIIPPNVKCPEPRCLLCWPHVSGVKAPCMSAGSQAACMPQCDAWILGYLLFCIIAQQSGCDDADDYDAEPGTDVQNESYEAELEPADDKLVGKVRAWQVTWQACRQSGQVRSLHPEPCVFERAGIRLDPMCLSATELQLACPSFVLAQCLDSS